MCTTPAGRLARSNPAWSSQLSREFTSREKISSCAIKTSLSILPLHTCLYSARLCLLYLYKLAKKVIISRDRQNRRGRTNPQNNINVNIRTGRFGNGLRQTLLSSQQRSEI